MNIVESKKRYIHYSKFGAKHFIPGLFKPVKNLQLRNKPEGGLWASPIDAKFGWKDWCNEEGFRECDNESSFIFKLKPGNRVLNLKKLSDSEGYSRNFDSLFDVSEYLGGNIIFDFERLRDEFKIDAIELEDYNEFYMALWGWDCACILILNPDAIEEVSNDH